MKCANHPQTDSVAFCGQCGRALCDECQREVRGAIYCERCLAARLQTAGVPLAPTGIPRPGVALALGLIPGVGAIYNGQVMKAMVQVLIFGSLIAMGNRAGGPMDTVFGLGSAAFYFYMVIDSYQTAKRKQLGQASEEWLGVGNLRMNAPIGAALLIGLGAMFLLDNLGVPVFRHIGKFWPVLLIVVGVIMLQKRMARGMVTPPSGSETPGAPKEGSGNIPGPQGL